MCFFIKSLPVHFLVSFSKMSAMIRSLCYLALFVALAKSLDLGPVRPIVDRLKMIGEQLSSSLKNGKTSSKTTVEGLTKEIVSLNHLLRAFKGRNHKMSLFLETS